MRRQIEKSATGYVGRILGFPIYPEVAIRSSTRTSTTSVVPPISHTVTTDISAGVESPLRPIKRVLFIISRNLKSRILVHLDGDL